MSRIILDFGSGNTCKNDCNYIKRMIDELAAVDTHKHEIIIKWQLFEKAGENKPLDSLCFRLARYYADLKGYKTTASVFDKQSLKQLLRYDVPFVKIANNRSLDYLIGEVPRKVPVYVSIGSWGESFTIEHETELMVCVSKYPATIEDYQASFDECDLDQAVSDHTTNFDLWHKYKPEIIEFHFKLEDSTGLDAGNFARTPKQLSEIL